MWLGHLNAPPLNSLLTSCLLFVINAVNELIQLFIQRTHLFLMKELFHLLRDSSTSAGVNRRHAAF